MGVFTEQCYEHCRKILKKSKESSRDSGAEIELILGFLRAERFQIEQEIEPYLLPFGDNKKTQPKQQNTGTREPSTIVCIDEARGLLNHHNSAISPFRSFQRALATCWEPFRTEIEWCNPGRDYFGLLLDTTSRVSNFSPSADKDISLKLGVPFGHGKIHICH